MRDESTVFLLGNPDLSTSNDRSGQAGAEEISSLVDSVALNRAEAELFDKLLPQVENDHLLGTNLESLLFDLIPRLVLANIGQEAHNLVVFLDEPFQDRAGVQTA